jgi:AraC-like DNA-binding protein
MQFDSLRDYSLLTGIGIQVVDGAGATSYITDQYHKTMGALDFLIELLDVSSSTKEVTAKSLTRSIEYGGLYTFLDPRGLTFVTAPIFKGGICEKFIIGGPIILSDIDDYLEYEVIAQAKKSVNPTKAREIISAIPVSSPTMVSAFSEQLFVNASFISGGNLPTIYSTVDGIDTPYGNNSYLEPPDLKRMRVRAYMYDKKERVNEQYQLLKALQDQDDLQAKVLLNEILEQILFHPRNNMDFIKSRVVELIMIMASSAMRSGADLKLVAQLRNRAFLEIEEHSSFDEIVAWLNQIFNLFLTHTFKNPNSKHAFVIKQSMAYMLEHYNERITLSDVAAHVSFSPTYLCTLFKTEMGQNFKGCLNRIRIEKSKDLMPDHKLSIADISYAVGFSDQSYFARVFKQHEGITPYHYRLTCKPMESD